MKNKFDDQDRQRVVSALEEQIGSKLQKVGKRKIYLQDDDGHRFWVFGGVGLWHGIPKDMMDSEVEEIDNRAHQNLETSLIVALKKTSSIEVFRGPSMDFIKGRSLLGERKNQYHFNCENQNGGLQIREIASVRLSHILQIEWDLEQRANEFLARTKKQLLKLSPSELAAVLAIAKSSS
jgi:hypothetical protein